MFVKCKSVVGNQIFYVSASAICSISVTRQQGMWTVDVYTVAEQHYVYQTCETEDIAGETMLQLVTALGGLVTVVKKG